MEKESLEEMIRDSDYSNHYIKAIFSSVSSAERKKVARVLKEYRPCLAKSIFPEK